MEEEEEQNSQEQNETNSRQIILVNSTHIYNNIFTEYPLDTNN